MKVVIFGASGGAIKVAQTFQNLDIAFDFFVDNDSKKWGSIVCGKKVKSPDILQNKEYKIVIASDYQDEIEQQLVHMGILSNLILKEELILPALEKRIVEFDENKVSYKEKREHTIFFDLIDAGICLGGIESWTLMLMRRLQEKNRATKLLARKKEFKTPKDIERNTKLFDISYLKYFESIKDIFEELVQNLPCTIITSWQSQVMLAAILVQKMYPEKINIISIIHNDKVALYRRQAFYEPYTKKIMGVSEKINEILIKKYGVPKDKIFYKESPVEFPKELNRTYTLDIKNPIQIGFAARISKYQKRIDLLIKLIALLDEKNVNYHMKIAGDGSYYANLQKWYQEYENKTKVELIGKLAREKMNAFWKKEDIFLSVSDFEGASISMLEAMSEGAVPIVTKVSGVEEFVQNEWNGLFAEVRDIDAIAAHLQKMDLDRNILEIYGKRSRRIIEEKCNIDEYCSILINEISN